MPRAEAAGHYLLLHVSAGAGFDRVFFPLLTPEETAEAATERWLDQQVEGRQRNVEKARRAAAAKIEDRRLCHPTSWYRDNELGAFAPKTLRRKTQARKR